MSAGLIFGMMVKFVAPSRFQLAKTLLLTKFKWTELSPLTRGTIQVLVLVHGSFECHVVSPTTKNCCETSLAGVEGGVA